MAFTFTFLCFILDVSLVYNFIMIALVSGVDFFNLHVLVLKFDHKTLLLRISLHALNVFKFTFKCFFLLMFGTELQNVLN